MNIPTVVLNAAPEVNGIDATTLIGLGDGSVKLTPALLKDESFGKAYGCLTDVIDALTDLKKKADEAIKVLMGEEYENGGDTTVVSGPRKYTYVPGTTKVSVDTKKLQKEMPEIYVKYSKTSNVSPSLRVTAVAKDVVDEVVPPEGK